jgi:predicted alpha-1,6-mannanase (GH76 family)
MVRSFVLTVLAASLLQASTSASDAHDLSKQSQQMITRLQQWYDPDTGLWKSTGWWNSANALTVIVDYSRITSTNEFASVLDHSFHQHSNLNFLNQYYDDEGWWALAWIDAYDLTRNPDYLSMASTIFDDMSKGWDNTCGGGIWWSKDRNYKNAIANELFLSVAAHLANRATTKEEKTHYKTWATREWAWLLSSSMIREDNQINDGLDQNCKNNNKTVWSYNQGVILGALTELSNLHDKKAPLEHANQIADAAIKNLTDPEGVLYDACEPNCGGDDVPQFKGIFVRNLAILQHRSPHRSYADFIQANAASIVAHQDADHTIGIDWSKPTTTASAATQTSALDAIVAALSLAATSPPR